MHIMPFSLYCIFAHKRIVYFLIIYSNLCTVRNYILFNECHPPLQCQQLPKSLLENIPHGKKRVPYKSNKTDADPEVVKQMCGNDSNDQSWKQFKFSNNTNMSKRPHFYFRFKNLKEIVRIVIRYRNQECLKPVFILLVAN